MGRFEVNRFRSFIVRSLLALPLAFAVLVGPTSVSQAQPYTPAQLAQSGMWVSNHLQIPTYISVASLPSEIAVPATHPTSLFNPTQLDFDEYMKWSRNLGATGAILTTKHVDGFCLWPSAVTSGGNKRTIVEAPWYTKNGNRNVLLEHNNKARQHGLRVGYYFCIWDEYLESLHGGTPASVTVATYTQWTKDQLSEILNEDVYGTIDFILLDGWGDIWTPIGGVGYTDVDYDEIYAHIKELQPNCVIGINDHLDGSEPALHGDVAIFERPTTGEPVAGQITGYQGAFLWDTTQDKVADAIAVAWFDHIDGDTMVAASAGSPIGRRFRMENLASPPVGYLMNFSSYLDGRLAADTRVMLAEFLRPANTRNAYDNFSLRLAEVAGVNLQSHTALDLKTWTKTFGTASAVINPYGRCFINDVTGAVYTNSATMAASGQRTVIDFSFPTVPANFNLSAMVRMNGAATQDYRCDAVWTGTTLTIGLKRNNSGLTTIQSVPVFVADNPAVNKKYRLACQAVGSEIRGEFWIDNTGTGNAFHLWGKFIATDATLAGPGSCGFYISSATASATTGLHLESFEALDIDTTPPTAPVLQFASARDNGIALRWTSVSSDVLLFEVWRSTDGATAEHIQDTRASEWLDETAASGVRYDYYVKAVDKSFNESANSNVIRASWTATTAIHDAQTAVEQIAQLVDDLAAMAQGSAISPTFVAAGRMYRFDNDTQITSPNVFTEFNGFDRVFGMDFTTPMSSEVSILQVLSVTISPTVGDEPVLGTPTISPDKKKVHIPIDAKQDEEDEAAVDAGTYTLTTTIKTTDEQVLVRKATLIIP